MISAIAVLVYHLETKPYNPLGYIPNKGLYPHDNNTLRTQNMVLIQISTTTSSRNTIIENINISFAPSVLTIMINHHQGAYQAVHSIVNIVPTDYMEPIFVYFDQVHMAHFKRPRS